MRPAGAPGDYTNRRAQLIIAHGLCVCAGRGPLSGERRSVPPEKSPAWPFWHGGAERVRAGRPAAPGRGDSMAG
ncbi:hypothetical protein ACFY4C_27860 [Actinomadura viridis]|uniref:hypothetical protein n=1 Tax=Actinomadura viridis TaxID=58110 RepID=UPI0036CE5531